MPAKSRPQVVQALEDRGFALDRSAHTYVNPSAHHARTYSSHSYSSSSSDRPGSHPIAISPTASSTNLPSTPPPTTLSELQTRTFALLKRRAVTPTLQSKLKLVQCAGRSDPSDQSDTALSLALLTGITACLLHPPPFFSLTCTASEAPSLLLDRGALKFFPSQEALLGAKDDYLVPVTLDLHSVPVEAPGIVCGLSARLVGRGGMSWIDLSYLSTARGAVVLVAEEDLARTADLLCLEEAVE